MTRRGLAVLCVGCLLVVLAGSWAVADSSRASRLPHSHAPYYHGDDDGPVSMAQSPGGTLWAVWSYRHGGELDVAVSRSIGRTWTPPQVIDGLDGWDDRDPQIAFLPDGSALVTWWQQRRDGASRVLVALVSGSETSSPRVVSAPDVNARQPRLYTEGESISVGFITENPDTGEGGFTLMPVSPNRPNGGTNGPDPIPTISIQPGETPPTDGRQRGGSDGEE
jgi:hypothetical protein